MFGSNILEVGMGLVFIFLTLSLTVTALNEAIATFSRSRAKHLEEGIRNLLKDKLTAPEPPQDSGAKKKAPSPDLADALLAHPIIASLARAKTCPAYLSAQTFASVLLRVVHVAGAKGNPGAAGPAQPNAAPFADFDSIIGTIKKLENRSVAEALLSLANTARANADAGAAFLQQFRTEIEGWFDQAMDRVSGWYKRRTQMWVLAIALIAVVALNVDSVAICRQLATDGALRATLVEAAKQGAAQTSATVAEADASLSRRLETVKTSMAGVKSLGIPLGWSGVGCQSTTEVLTKAAGLLLTAFAASLGAPFWFDILNMFMNVRGAGTSPAEKTKKPA